MSCKLISASLQGQVFAVLCCPSLSPHVRCFSFPVFLRTFFLSPHHLPPLWGSSWSTWSGYKGRIGLVLLGSERTQMSLPVPSVLWILLWVVPLTLEQHETELGRSTHTETCKVNTHSTVSVFSLPYDSNNIFFPLANLIVRI